MTASVTGNDGYTYTYQNDTDLSLVTSMTNPRGNMTAYTYDNRRRLTLIQAGSSCDITNTYADDRLVKIRHNNVGSNYTEFNLAYTKADLLSSVKVGSAYTLVQNTYDTSKWTLTKQSYGNSTAWKYEYNDFDQPTRRWTTGGSTGTEFKSFYNSEGALARVEQYSTTLSGDNVTGRTLLSTERYYYDTLNRLTCTRVTDSDGEHSFRWTYDSNNNVTQLEETVNGRDCTYAHAYNADQQPTQTTYGSARKAFTYDALSRLSQTAVSWNSSPVLTTNYSYKDLTDTRTTTQVATLQNVYGNTETFTYTYDNRGNIATVSDGTDTTTYSYNFLNEMTWEYNEKEQKAWKYVSDKVGNITSKTQYTYQNGQTSNPVVMSYAYDNSGWRDLLTSYSVGNTTYNITYDGVGNPLSYRDWTFTWKGGRQLASASKGSTSLSFVYNNSGLRIKKTVGTEEHRFVYLGSRLAAEITDSYALYFHYDAKGSPVGFTYANGNTETEYFYVKNLQGDIIKVIGTSGTSVAEYSYDAWGRILSDTPTPGTLAAINPLRYRGYYYDAELGLYYLRSRYYDPEVCRFINADAFVSTGQGIIGYNMFAYCGNNPVHFKDTQGHIIRLADEATEEEREQYQKAIDYLKTSETGAALIDRLDSSEVVFTVMVFYENNMYYDPEANTIFFNPYLGLVIKGGRGVMSPALGLLHEMGHAAQDLDGLSSNFHSDLFRDIVDAIFESLDVIQYERPAARELKESSRYSYYDSNSTTRMRSPTSRVLGFTRTWKNRIDLWK